MIEPPSIPRRPARPRQRKAARAPHARPLIEDGLRLVADGRKAVKGKRVLPPISKATGGPLPGVDLADLSALQETDDLDQVARMQRFK